MNDVTDPYQDLGNAIIKRAYQDWILLSFCKLLTVYTKNGEVVSVTNDVSYPISKDEIMGFYKSGLYSAITDVDYTALIKLADQEVEIITEALNDGLDFNAFQALHYNDMYSISRYDYGNFRKGYKERTGIFTAIKKFEQQDCVSNVPYVKENKRQAYYICKNYLRGRSDTGFNDDGIYILIKDNKISFWKYDSGVDDLYKIYDKGRKLVYKRVWYYKDLQRWQR